MEDFQKFLQKNKIDFLLDFNISQFSSIKIGGKIKLVVLPKTTKQLVSILKFCYSKKIYYRVFGNLSNVLFVSEISYPIILTSKMQDEVSYDENLVTVSSGVLLSRLCEQLKRRELSGLEALSGIPATVGGAIFNNAGAFGSSISDHLVSVQVFFQGKIIILQKNDIKFSYHKASLFGFIVLQATFLFENRNEYAIINMCNEFAYKRNKTQPSGLSLGSVFNKCNDLSAGFYIERSGLKGKKIGGVYVSNKHANFFINDGSGQVYDFLALLKLVEDSVSKNFGVTLYTEIEKVG